MGEKFKFPWKKSEHCAHYVVLSTRKLDSGWTNILSIFNTTDTPVMIWKVGAVCISGRKRAAIVSAERVSRRIRAGESLKPVPFANDEVSDLNGVFLETGASFDRDWAGNDTFFLRAVMETPTEDGWADLWEFEPGISELFDGEAGGPIVLRKDEGLLIRCNGPFNIDSFIEFEREMVCQHESTQQ